MTTHPTAAPLISKRYADLLLHTAPLTNVRNPVGAHRTVWRGVCATVAPVNRTTVAQTIPGGALGSPPSGTAQGPDREASITPRVRGAAVGGRDIVGAITHGIA